VTVLSEQDLELCTSLQSLFYRSPHDLVVDGSSFKGVGREEFHGRGMFRNVH